MRSTLIFSLLLCACGEPDKPGDSGEPDDTAVTHHDLDGDGYATDVDCDDGDPTVHPEADELCNDGDDDCDGDVDEDAIDASTWYRDSDGDGWGDPEDTTQTCEQPEDAVADGTDCNDDDPNVHPDADEICYDDADNDCDGDTDEDCAYPDDYPLEGADAVLYGSTEGGLAGYAVSSAGDVNGDGYDDLLIGAPEAAWEGTELDGHYETGRGTGAAMVVLGPAIGELDLTEADAWVQGSNTEDEYWSDTGWSVAGVGDTNGDGFDDVLIGAPEYFTYTETWDGERAGMAGLFLGPVSGIDHLENADASCYISGYASNTGYDVAGAGDINDDGLDDILIGSPGSQVIFVVIGPMSGDLDTSEL